MKIVIASDSFKGSLSSKEVAESLERGILDVFPSCDVVKLAVADGGEGTMEALRQTLGGEPVGIQVEDPLGRMTGASYVILDDGVTAVVEMSAASGLTLLEPDERNPWNTSTYGTGQMIADALARGCRRFLVGIGGSAANDGGMGMLKALGFRFLDVDCNELPGVGASLAEVSRVDDSGVSQAVRDAEFIVACDVDSPLYGPQGAAYVFAPQKGADPEMVKALDDGLRHYAVVTAAYVNSLRSRSEDNLHDEEVSLLVEADVVPDMAYVSGAGAAGGLGYAFVAFLGAILQRGVDMVLDAVGFDSIIGGADLVITGEGRIDAQTLTGKTPYGVLQRASRQNIPVIALAGTVALDDSLTSIMAESVSEATFAGRCFSEETSAVNAYGSCLQETAQSDSCNSRFRIIRQITPPGMPLSQAMDPAIASANLRRTISILLQRCKRSD